MDLNTLLNDIEHLAGIELQSIGRGSAIVVDRVDRDAKAIYLHTVEGKTITRSFNEINILWNKLKTGTAVHVETALAGSGSSRNQPETILANLPYIEWVKLNNRKHIVFVGHNSHKAGTLKEMTSLEYQKIFEYNHAQGADLEHESRNLIFFGAPGTGKSYQLNMKAIKTEDNPNGLFLKDHVRRVTFYPDYQYAQFVGSYRPFSKEDKVGYHYIAGPFLKTYLDASTHPNENYLLIVEEINRANPAAVFGDVFQLLDRNSYGTSEYQISVPADMAECIGEYLGQLSNAERENIESSLDPDMNFEGFKDSMTREMDLPRNMFIWATMNSADQGVFPMDTAFKRRWDFCYIGIDDGEGAEIDGELLSEKVVTCGERKVYWNELRKAINTLMTKECKINEDKLLGPFFLRPDDLTDERFGDAFKDKVLMYLYEDAGKMKRRDLFWDYPVTYSQVCAKFNDDGVAVFGKGFDAKDIWADKEGEAVDNVVPSEE